MKIRKSLAIFILILGFAVGFKSVPSNGPNPIDPSRLSGEYDRSREIGEFMGRQVFSKLVAFNPSALNVLGTTTGPKRIEVDLARQRVYAFEGNNKVFEFVVSTGKWGRTPTGTFTIANKLRYTGMSGGSVALGTYYNLPNVPFVMFFGNNEIPWSRGFSLHGTYWHNNFGHPMSHGCVNMRTEDIEKLYYWAEPGLRDKPSIVASADNPGTTVIIYGEPPAE